MLEYGPLSPSTLQPRCESPIATATTSAFYVTQTHLLSLLSEEKVMSKIN